MLLCLQRAPDRLAETRPQQMAVAYVVVQIDFVE
jgi:hypothetical protein